MVGINCSSLSEVLKYLFLYLNGRGSGCSTVVGLTPDGIEVVDSNLVGTGLFSSLFCPIRSESFNQVPHGGATLLIFLFRKYVHSCAA